MFHGYAVDMTRTVTIGPANIYVNDVCWILWPRPRTPRLRRCRPGALATDIDRAARNRWRSAGLAEAFGHGTGHGLGLEVHERPRVAAMRPGLPGEPLQPGMVFTIEPGRYFPGGAARGSRMTRR